MFALAMRGPRAARCAGRNVAGRHGRMRMDEYTSRLCESTSAARFPQAQPGLSMSDPNWSAARAAMLLDDRFINLNTGSFGPPPRPVFGRVPDLRRQLAAAPMEFLLRTQPPLLWDARPRLAAFVGTAPERLVFTANVSVAINLVASALR